MNPDQAQINMKPDLDPSCLTFMTFFFLGGGGGGEELFILKKKISLQQRACKITQHAKGKENK